MQTALMVLSPNHLTFMWLTLRFRMKAWDWTSTLHKASHCSWEKSPSRCSRTCENREFSSVQFTSKWYVSIQEAHKCSTLSLRNFPKCCQLDSFNNCPTGNSPMLSIRGGSVTTAFVVKVLLWNSLKCIYMCGVLTPFCEITCYMILLYYYYYYYTSDMFPRKYKLQWCMLKTWIDLFHSLHLVEKAPSFSSSESVTNSIFLLHTAWQIPQTMRNLREN